MSFTEHDYDQIADRLFQRIQARETNSVPDLTCCHALAKELKVTVRTVVKRCRKLGIELKQPGKRFNIWTKDVPYLKNSF